MDIYYTFYLEIRHTLHGYMQMIVDIRMHPLVMLEIYYTDILHIHLSGYILHILHGYTTYSTWNYCRYTIAYCRYTIASSCDAGIFTTSTDTLYSGFILILSTYMFVSASRLIRLLYFLTYILYERQR